ncbi:MAG: AAA family ATPase [Alphaproteobacteria bacterium]|nr:AAA family ATPase [Alphaproteobacteria bacterium]MCB9696072.1 AAA family ATPase [Alphaproteobacteria bacterium]
MEALRLPAERRCALELAALRAGDTDPRPAGWALSPRAVETFVLGSGGRTLPVVVDGEERQVAISRKLYGQDILVQRAIVTLASDRALLLIGEPGTAKSWLSEHLAAAISGDSLLVVQGSAGLVEDQIRYGWNYAMLLAEGPSPKALVPGPMLTGMRSGRIVRFEELTRAPPEVQDTLLQALSEKVLTIPELAGEEGVVLARPGFNLVATANTRDRGVNEMSAALQRRFHFETVPPLDDLQQEVEVVRSQVAERTRGTPAERTGMDDDVLELLVTTFHELRSGKTVDGVALDRPSTAMSTAEAVAVGQHAALFAAFFGEGAVKPEHVVLQLAGTAAKLDADDRKVLRGYFDVAVKPRASRELGLWKAYFAARHHLGG